MKLEPHYMECNHCKEIELKHVNTVPATPISAQMLEYECQSCGQYCTFDGPLPETDTVALAQPLSVTQLMMRLADADLRLVVAEAEAADINLSVASESVVIKAFYRGVTLGMKLSKDLSKFSNTDEA